MGALVNVSLIFIIYLIVMLVAAIFVYQDARKRNMGAIGWALLAFFVPMLLGVIVYLICRNPLIDMQCPNCGAGIGKEARECPQCKRPLLTQCPECEFPVQRGWKTCPKCGCVLPENYAQPIRSYRKDNGIVVIIVIVVLVVLGLILASFSLVKMNHGGTHISEGYAGYEGMYNISKEDMGGNDAITSWIEESDKSNKDVFVLLSKSSNTCLIYVKNNEYLMECNLSLDYYDEKECDMILDIESSQYKDSFGYDFFLYEFEVYEDTEVMVNLDRNTASVEVSFTDADISMSTWGGQANE